MAQSDTSPAATANTSGDRDGKNEEDADIDNHAEGSVGDDSDDGMSAAERGTKRRRAEYDGAEENDDNSDTALHTAAESRRIGGSDFIRMTDGDAADTGDRGVRDGVSITNASTAPATHEKYGTAKCIPVSSDGSNSSSIKKKQKNKKLKRIS